MSRKNSLRPLKDRLNSHQLARRQQHMDFRYYTNSEKFNFLYRAMFGFVHLGFFGRLKWLVLGAPKGN